MAQPCPAQVESSSPKNPPHPPLVSPTSIAPPGTGNPAAHSTDTQLPAVNPLTERSLAHETALRQLEGLDSQQKRGRKAPDAASTASTQPVLVREYSQNSPRPSIRQSRMRKYRNSSGNRDSSEMPPMESFSFQDILASIDPEVHGSIDRIAEICGRSKMSLADEYSSHLPPQADFSLLGVAEQAGISRLEPVEEASSTHEDIQQDPRPTHSRAARLSLVGTSNHARGDLSSTPVTATSAVASSPQSIDVQELSGSFSSAVTIAFDRPFPVPGTDTVLWLSEGQKVAPIPLRILLGRAQLDLNALIVRYGPEAVPGRNPDVPKYSYLTQTPRGVEGYLFVNALSGGKLTYGLVNETLTGLRLYFAEQRRSENCVFEVESRKQRVAFGGVSIGPQAETLEALSNNTALANDRTSLAGIVNMDLRLKCTFARHLHSAIVAYLLNDAEEEVKEIIRREGPNGRLPGVAGEWEKDGHRGCLFTIDGIVPAHVTWQMTQAAIAAMKLLLVGDHVPREATCTMILGDEVIGVTRVKQKELGVAQE
ncbi:MAG: hypothetical protein Q9208_001228 [Pyrenodesmia sp. 3 TL-2023]